MTGHSSYPAVCHSPFLEVLLVIILCLPELRGRRDLGDDLPRVFARPLKLLLRSSRGGLFVRVAKEDHRSILRANVGTLAIERGRIVNLPEHIEQLIIRHLRRVVGHFNALSVSGSARADIRIGRVIVPAAGVADSRRCHALDLAKRRLNSPEAARSKCCNLHFSQLTFYPGLRIVVTASRKRQAAGATNVERESLGPN